MINTEVLCEGAEEKVRRENCLVSVWIGGNGGSCWSAERESTTAACIIIVPKLCYILQSGINDDNDSPSGLPTCGHTPLRC